MEWVVAGKYMYEEGHEEVVAAILKNQLIIIMRIGGGGGENRHENGKNIWLIIALSRTRYSSL